MSATLSADDFIQFFTSPLKSDPSLHPFDDHITNEFIHQNHVISLSTKRFENHYYYSETLFNAPFLQPILSSSSASSHKNSKSIPPVTDPSPCPLPPTMKVPTLHPAWNEGKAKFIAWLCQYLTWLHSPSLPEFPKPVPPIDHSNHDNHHHNSLAGNSVLVFLPGIKEIEAVYANLQPLNPKLKNKNNMENNEPANEDEEKNDNIEKKDDNDNSTINHTNGDIGKQMEILILHSQINTDDQDAVRERVPIGVTRIILSTNIAESSLTLPSIRYIIDSGLCRQMKYDHRNEMNQLSLSMISKASAKQRAGRAGRLCDGWIFRLYSEKTDWPIMDNYETPELLRSELDMIVHRLQVLSQERDEQNDSLNIQQNNKNNNDDDSNNNSNGKLLEEPLINPYLILSDCMHPPSGHSIDESFIRMIDFGALQLPFHLKNHYHKILLLLRSTSSGGEDNPSSDEDVEDEKEKQVENQRRKKEKKNNANNNDSAELATSDIDDNYGSAGDENDDNQNDIKKDADDSEDDDIDAKHRSAVRKIKNKRRRIKKQFRSLIIQSKVTSFGHFLSSLALNRRHSYLLFLSLFITPAPLLPYSILMISGLCDLDIIISPSGFIRKKAADEPSSLYRDAKLFLQTEKIKRSVDQQRLSDPIATVDAVLLFLKQALVVKNQSINNTNTPSNNNNNIKFKEEEADWEVEMIDDDDDNNNNDKEKKHFSMRGKLIGWVYENGFHWKRLIRLLNTAMKISQIMEEYLDNIIQKTINNQNCYKGNRFHNDNNNNSGSSSNSNSSNNSKKNQNDTSTSSSDRSGFEGIEELKNKKNDLRRLRSSLSWKKMLKESIDSIPLSISPINEILLKLLLLLSFNNDFLACDINTIIQDLKWDKKDLPSSDTILTINSNNNPLNDYSLLQRHLRCTINSGRSLTTSQLFEAFHPFYHQQNVRQIFYNKTNNQLNIITNEDNQLSRTKRIQRLFLSPKQQDGLIKKLSKYRNKYNNNNGGNDDSKTLLVPLLFQPPFPSTALSKMTCRGSLKFSASISFTDSNNNNYDNKRKTNNNTKANDITIEMKKIELKGNSINFFHYHAIGAEVDKRKVKVKESSSIFSLRVGRNKVPISIIEDLINNSEKKIIHPFISHNNNNNNKNNGHSHDSSLHDLSLNNTPYNVLSDSDDDDDSKTNDFDHHYDKNYLFGIAGSIMKSGEKAIVADRITLLPFGTSSSFTLSSLMMIIALPLQTLASFDIVLFKNKNEINKELLSRFGLSKDALQLAISIRQWIDDLKIPLTEQQQLSNYHQSKNIIHKLYRLFHAFIPKSNESNHPLFDDVTDDDP